MVRKKKGEKFYMYSTGIEPDVTANDINRKLRTVGATHILTEYDPQTSEAIGIYFMMPVEGKRISFSIPVRWKKVQAAMKESGLSGKYIEEDQAKRVAWRVAFRWVEAQVALIQCGNAETAEVFMPYAVVDAAGTTLFQKLRDTGFKQIEAPKGS
ncbi:hypothetical protein LCGC14_0430520 [marine sediment metagenome]|uniref:Uncharacterized protein n=1 Tax=marine sediment metagenome TaxID=412755 RepID=A0A0F9SUD4_9ZZZZ